MLWSVKNSAQAAGEYQRCAGGVSGHSNGPLPAQCLCSTQAHRACGGGSALVKVSWCNSQKPGRIGIGEVVHASG